MSYTLVWKVVSSIAIEDSVLKYRKVRNTANRQSEPFDLFLLLILIY
jgi:hypothetical protein